MKKAITLAAIVIMAAIICTHPAQAAERYELLPVDVISFPDRLEIHKIYEMSTSADPTGIPRDSFTRGEVEYACTDIIREMVIGDEVLSHTVTETVDSASNKIDEVLALLPPTKEYTSDDGFFGILRLDTASIRTDVSGYGSRSQVVNVTRSYPNLSDKDTQHIPKTVTEGDKSYDLEDIKWQTDNTYNADDYEIGNRFTAIATYSGTSKSYYIKGYTITANYNGDIVRTGIAIVRYTVIFTGSRIQTQEPEQPTEPEQPAEPVQDDEPEDATKSAQDEMATNTGSEPMPQEKRGFNWWFLVLPVLGLLIGAGAAYIYLKHKERANDEEESDNGYTDPYADDSDNIPGAGV